MPLHIAIAKGNEEIAQLLLEKQDIDVSIKSILNHCFFISFKNENF